MKSFVVLVCVALCGLAECGRALFITPCREVDTACMTASAQRALPVFAAGLPQFGISTLDPMRVMHMKSTSSGVTLEVRDTTITGLKNCHVLNLRRSGPRAHLELKCSVVLAGDYTLQGQAVLVPINGNGKYAITIRDIVVKVDFEVGEKTVNGEKYWTVKSWTQSYDMPQNVHYQFGNMYNGNVFMSDTAHLFMNTNWAYVFQQGAPTIVNAIVTQIVSETEKLFNHVPIKELVVQ